MRKSCSIGGGLCTQTISRWSTGKGWIKSCGGSRSRSGYGLQSMSPTSMARIGCFPGFQLLKPMPKLQISVQIADVLMNPLHTYPLSRDKGQSLIFLESITSLMQWLGNQQTDPEVVHLFRRYLSGRGTRTMASLVGQPSQFCLAAEYHNRLGWDNFLKGQISALWVELRARDIHDRRLERNVDYWACGIMRRLLKMVHQQWLYCNATVHMSLQDGLPRDKHEQILTRIKHCLGIDLGDLLPLSNQ